MSSIIQGYEYDIFISYRQKDNKYDGWVTEFVENLRKELEATFKDEISIYLDENPHDGILETYNVDKSLENKLKCLIFIPIISQTYCDPRSFAWQNEFIAFHKMALEDVFGRDIRLENGNTASRILPVKIHDIDATDKTLLEAELGGPIRSVEFIFKSSGVNRPLKPDDSRTENLNHTYYRDQINKVANAVKEIITALKFHISGQNDLFVHKLDSKSNSVYKGSKKANLKIAIWSFIILVLAVSGYFLIPALSKTIPDDADKSIAVLPFENLSNDPDQDSFGDGIMQEILNHLFKIGGLEIPSGTSSMRYKGSKLSVKDIARELNVSYVLEGNVSSSGDNVRIIVRMVSGKDERLIWTEDYKKSKTATNLLEIQSEIAQQVAEKMNVAINPEAKRRIEARPTENTEAYNLYLAASENDDLVKPLMEKAIMLDTGFAEAYALLATYWLLRGAYNGDLDREQVLQKAEPLVNKALMLDNNSALSHSVMASVRLWYYWDFITVEKEYKTYIRIAPSNSEWGPFTDYLLASERFDEALEITKKEFDHDSIAPEINNYMGLAYYFNNMQEMAIRTLDNAIFLFPEDKYLADGAIRVTVYSKNYRRTLEIFENIYHDYQVQDIKPNLLGFVGIAYYKSGDLSRSASFLNELLAKSRNSSIGSPSFYAAATYSVMGEKDKAIQSLEKAFNDHEIEMYWLKVDPLFKTLYGDPRFEKILANIGFK